MAYPIFDGFSLQDDNYIVENITYRTIPKRDLETGKTARIPGVKLLSTDFAEREVTFSGYIIAASVSDLRTKIDALHTNVTRKESGQLYVESDRSATAIISTVEIADPHYAQDFVPFNLKFLMTDPFFYGAQQTVSFTITSGTLTTTQSVTVSGTYWAEPTFIYTAPGTTGNTTISGIRITYAETGEYVTWSGTGGSSVLPYGTSVTFDYITRSILQNTSEVDIDGVFARWNPGVQSFTTTFSGSMQGGTLQMAYQPRYL